MEFVASLPPWMSTEMQSVQQEIHPPNGISSERFLEGKLTLTAPSSDQKVAQQAPPHP